MPHFHQPLLGLSNSIQHSKFPIFISDCPVWSRSIASVCPPHLGSATPDRVTGECYVRGSDRIGLDRIAGSASYCRKCSPSRIKRPFQFSAPYVSVTISLPALWGVPSKADDDEEQAEEQRTRRCPGGGGGTDLGLAGIGGPRGGGGTRHNFKHLQDFSLNWISLCGWLVAATKCLRGARGVCWIAVAARGLTHGRGEGVSVGRWETRLRSDDLCNVQ